MKSFVDRPLLEPIGDAKGMTAAAPADTRSRAVYRSGVHVGQYDEAFLGQDFRRLYRFDIVGKQVFRIAHDFDFDKVAATDFAGQTGDADGFVGVAGARRVGKKGYALGNEVEDIIFLPGFDAAQGHRDDLRAGLFDGSLNQVDGILARTENEAGCKFMTAENQRVFLFHEKQLLCICCCMR